MRGGPARRGFNCPWSWRTVRFQIVVAHGGGTLSRQKKGRCLALEGGVPRPEASADIHSCRTRNSRPGQIGYFKSRSGLQLFKAFSASMLRSFLGPSLRGHHQDVYIYSAAWGLNVIKSEPARLNLEVPAWTLIRLSCNMLILKSGWPQARKGHRLDFHISIFDAGLHFRSFMYVYNILPICISWGFRPDPGLQTLMFRQGEFSEIFKT